MSNQNEVGTGNKVPHSAQGVVTDGIIKDQLVSCSDGKLRKIKSEYIGKEIINNNRFEYPLTNEDLLQFVKYINYDFGHVIKSLKSGRKAYREGWNGKGMWLYMESGQKWAPEHFPNRHSTEFAQENGGEAEVLPYLVMKTADNKFVPWLASQTDVLAEDWCILD